MILEGNSRGGAKNLALHLLKAENEQVEIHEIRGFVSDDLVSALNESYAISRGTKARKHLFSLSLNPPKDENVPTPVFEDAINRVETKLGLEGQSRAIVFHVKDGRRHCHAVWSRIDTGNMKAIHLSHTKLKLMDISRELYLEQGWSMPKGFIRKQDRNPNNFTLAQWQQAKRTGQKAGDIKGLLRDCWAASDNQLSFQATLKEHGYLLAKGDRRSFVVIDQNCEVYSLPKWTNQKTKDVRARIKDKETLPDVATAKASIAKQMQQRLNSLKQHHESAIELRRSEITNKLTLLHAQQRQERRGLDKRQEDRQKQEVRARQKRYQKGWKALVDIFTGRRRAIAKQNEEDYYRSCQRDRAEKDNLIFQHLEKTSQLQQRMDRIDRFSQRKRSSIESDLEQYRGIQNARQNHFVRTPNRKGPSLNR